MFRGNTDIAPTRKHNQGGAAGLLVALVIAGAAYVGYKLFGKKPAKKNGTIPAGALAPGIHDVAVGTDVFLLAPRSDPSHMWVRLNGYAASETVDYSKSIQPGQRAVEMRFLKPGQYQVKLYYRADNIESTLWTIVAK